MAEQVHDNFVINVSKVFSTRILIRILSLGTSIIIARLLGPEGQGLVSLVLMVPFSLSVIGEIGIESANIYFTSKKSIKREYIVGNSFFLSLTWTLFLVAIVIVVIPFIHDKFLQRADLTLIFFALLIFPIDFFVASLRGVIIGEHRVNFYNLLFIINITATFIFTVILVLLLKIGVIGAILANLIGSMSGAVLIYIGYLLKEKVNIKISISELKKQFVYGIMPYLANLFGFLNYRIDIFIVSYFLDIRQVGYYALAIALTSKIHELPQSIMTIFFPLTSSQSDDEKRIYTPNIFRKSGLLMLVLGLAIIAVAKPGITFIFGYEFSESVIAFILLVIGRIMIRGNVGILSSDICGRGKPYIITWISAVLLPISIGLNILLIPKYGIIGAAFVTIIVSTIQEIMVIEAYLRISEGNFKDLILSIYDIKYMFSIVKDFTLRVIHSIVRG
ncbi:MAG: oligosaccharide flippase family protein [bacterium]